MKLNLSEISFDLDVAHIGPGMNILKIYRMKNEFTNSEVFSIRNFAVKS